MDACSIRDSQSISIVHRNQLLGFIVLATLVLFIFAILAWMAHCPRRLHLREFDEGSVAPQTETSTLLGTRFSSSATLHDTYHAYQSNATTASHTPYGSLRGSIKPVLQPVAHCNIIEEYSNYVTSPIENGQSLIEPPALVTEQPSSNGARGRASAITQAEPIVCDGFHQDAGVAQAHEPDEQRSPEVFTNCAPTLLVSPNTAPSNQASGLRAHTAPCLKTRSGSLVKSLTGFISTQTTVHVLAVAMGWGGGPGAIPGPLHDVDWLRNLFAQQKNFRFNSLVDHAATLVTIRRSLEDMLSVAGDNDLLVLYFSGHGGNNDSFELYDSASLNDVILNDWIVDYRSARPRSNPVYIIFDYCRPDRVKPTTELASGVNVIWACSPTESALDLKLKDPNNHLPRSCFLLSLILAIDDVSEDPTAPVVERFTNRMKEFVRVIRGMHCLRAKCRLSWRCCRCESCLRGMLCTHDGHKEHLPFQVVSIGGIEGNPNLSAVVEYIASRFPLHIKRAAEKLSKDHWVLHFNPSHVSANKRPLNPRNHRIGTNLGIGANPVRNMTIPANLLRF